jgi:hypothetical protein
MTTAALDIKLSLGNKAVGLYKMKDIADSVEYGDF